MADFFWSSTPNSGDYFNAGNWLNSNNAPSAGQNAFFDSSIITNIFLSPSIVTTNSIGGWFFTNVSNFSFTIGGSQEFDFIGAGIVSFGGNPGITINDTAQLHFANTSGAGGATITNNAVLQFDSNSTAGLATITNAGTLNFTDTSAAGRAFITTAAGGTTTFSSHSNGGQARFITAAGGKVDFSPGVGPGSSFFISAGSIAGAGEYDIGSNILRVGGNNLSTDVSGVIDGSDSSRGIEKVGTGSLRLSHDNGSTFLGGVSLVGGTLDVAAPNAAGTFVNLAGTNITLVIENAALSGHAFETPVTDFAALNFIDLSGLVFAAGAQATYDTPTHTLSVTSGSTTDTIDLLLLDPGTLVAYFDGHGGTAVAYANAVPGTINGDTLAATVSPDFFNGLAGPDFASYAGAPTGVTANLANPAFDTGWAGGDRYTGIEGLIGSSFADSLTGNAVANTLRGGLGRDVLTGGGGPDQFDFNSIAESAVGAKRDVIADFIHAQHDKIDLATIDANTGKAGNQSFVFIGSDTFAHYHALHPTVIGMLRFAGGILQGNVNGNLAADFEIAVHGSIPAVTDFVL